MIVDTDKVAAKKIIYVIIATLLWKIQPAVTLRKDCAISLKRPAPASTP